MDEYVRPRVPYTSHVSYVCVSMYVCVHVCMHVMACNGVQWNVRLLPRALYHDYDCRYYSLRYELLRFAASGLNICSSFLLPSILPCSLPHMGCSFFFRDALHFNA